MTILKNSSKNLTELKFQSVNFMGDLKFLLAKYIIQYNWKPSCNDNFNTGHNERVFQFSHLIIV